MFADLLAQAATESAPLPFWAQVGGGAISLGFAVWYAWYTTTKTIPDMNIKHCETVKEITYKHNDVIKELVGEFRTEAKDQRQAEQARAQVSAELARSGHSAMTQVVRAVDDLRATLGAHDIKVIQRPGGGP